MTKKKMYCLELGKLDVVDASKKTEKREQRNKKESLGLTLIMCEEIKIKVCSPHQALAKKGQNMEKTEKQKRKMRRNWSREKKAKKHKSIRSTRSTREAESKKAGKQKSNRHRNQEKQEKPKERSYKAEIKIFQYTIYSGII